jgi:hypothetical protein
MPLIRKIKRGWTAKILTPLLAAILLGQYETAAFLA